MPTLCPLVPTSSSSYLRPQLSFSLLQFLISTPSLPPLSVTSTPIPGPSSPILPSLILFSSFLLVSASQFSLLFLPLVSFLQDPNRFASLKACPSRLSRLLLATFWQVFRPPSPWQALLHLCIGKVKPFNYQLC